MTQGEVAFNSVGNEGENSALGSGGVIQVGVTSNNGTLRYTGDTDSTTNRELVVNGNATIRNDGVGTLVFNGLVSVTDSSSTNRSFILRGTNTGANRIYGDIVDATASRSLIKRDAGTWVLSGDNNYSGGTAIEQGILQAASAAALGVGDVSVGGFGESATLLVGADVELVLSSLVLDSGGRLGFELNGDFTATGIVALDQIGTGIYMVDIFDAGGFSEGFYTLLTVEAIGEAEGFQIGQMVEGYLGALVWNGNSLTLDVSVIPEPGLALGLFAGMVLLVVSVRRFRRDR